MKMNSNTITKPMCENELMKNYSCIYLDFENSTKIYAINLCYRHNPRLTDISKGNSFRKTSSSEKTLQRKGKDVGEPA